MINLLAKWLPTKWSKLSKWHVFLLPISWVYLLIIKVRKWLYKIGAFKSTALPVPVIIVGNINVGGTGKTPLTIHLVRQFKALGLNPGVISRGYGSKAQGVVAVDVYSDPADVGDEPLLIVRRTNCPLYVGRDRVAAGLGLLKDHPSCDIVISDDGLQHYALQRDLEVAVIDGAASFGNKALLPAGPLREPVNRLDSVDIMVINGIWRGLYRLEDATKTMSFMMHFKSDLFYNLKYKDLKSDGSELSDKSITAVAGIGNPDRFFTQLETFGLSFNKKVFPDHHAFSQSDFEDIETDIVVMTEKDAIKCQRFASPRFWVLPISADIDDEFVEVVLSKLDED